MKKIVLATVLAALGSASALAADLGPRAYTKAPMMAAPVSSWQGFYIGGNVGYGWAPSNSSAIFPAPNDFGLANQSLNTKPKGIIGGGQIGYNWQMGAFVTGLETDIQGSGINGSVNKSPLLLLDGTLDIPSHHLSAESKLAWFGTVRDRIGVAVTPDFLLYGTGGLAYGSVSSSQTFATLVNNFVDNISRTRLGWAAGAGVEWMFARNWSAKAEYLHIDLGSTSTSVIDTPTAGQPVLDAVTSKAHFNIVRAGVNYHF